MAISFSFFLSNLVYFFVCFEDFWPVVHPLFPQFFIKNVYSIFTSILYAVGGGGDFLLLFPHAFQWPLILVDFHCSRAGPFPIPENGTGPL